MALKIRFNYRTKLFFIVNVSLKFGWAYLFLKTSIG